MKTLVAVLVCLALLVAPVAAAERPPFMPGWTWESLAAWTGCGGVDIVVVEDDTPNAFFGVERALWMFEKPFIALTSGLLKLPAEQVFIVLLHELQHCRQWKEGRIGWGGSTVELEQEADVVASDLACRLGFPGPRFEEDFWRLLGVDLDRPSASHGAPRERIAETWRRAGACRSQVEAPYTGS